MIILGSFWYAQYEKIQMNNKSMNNKLNIIYWFSLKLQMRIQKQNKTIKWKKKSGRKFKTALNLLYIDTLYKMCPCEQAFVKINRENVSMSWVKMCKSDKARVLSHYLACSNH